MYIGAYVCEGVKEAVLEYEEAEPQMFEGNSLKSTDMLYGNRVSGSVKVF